MYKLITSPTSEPITTDEAKTHLNEDLDDATVNTYIDSLVTVARRYLEERTGYNCMAQTWELYLDEWPAGDVIFLHKKPITEITKVEYYATDDATEYSTLASSEYENDIHGDLSRIKIDDPPTLGDKLNAVKVTFKSGNASADDVDKIAKHAILLLVGSLYENRQDEITGTIVSKLGRNFEWACNMIELKTA